MARKKDEKEAEKESVLDRAMRWFDEKTEDGTANTWSQQNRARRESGRKSIYEMSDEEIKARSKKRK